MVDCSLCLASGKIKINTTESVLGDTVESQDRNYQTFPCLCERRSYPRPGVVGEVSLQDIDIIGAIGDSDTAAFAANSRGLDYFTEYWGSSFVTGDLLLLLPNTHIGTSKAYLTLKLYVKLCDC